MNYEFTFEYGIIYVDGHQASQSELMEILTEQQRKIEHLRNAIEFLEEAKATEED